MSKALHVVFQQSEYYKDVLFISHCKKDVELFFNRPSRQGGEYFHVAVKDKEKIKLFERDFADRLCEIEGTVCMLPGEHEMMMNSIPGLVNGLVDNISHLTGLLQYIQFTDEEFCSVMDMLKTCYLLLKAEYDGETEDGIFDMELLMDRYLQELGV